jgi:indolepyruvate ferredoxin oxidoreductase alpha subunit
MTRPLLGNEAVAQAALDAGITTATGYPGTPATEIFEHVERAARAGASVHASWSANEKAAYEQALGASLAGRRSLVVMKHVGLNVAADPFVNSALTGAAGGLVLAVADDPGMHSSQNEQDSRFYADFAQIPCYEPADPGEAYAMTREAFDVSEKFQTPVMVRLVTRVAHARAGVATSPARAQNPLAPDRDAARWTLLPTTARVRFDRLLAKQPALRAWSEASPFNELRLDPGDRAVGVIAAGVAYSYFREAVGERPPSFLRVGLYPAPEEKLRRLLDHARTIVVLEEGYPFLERGIRGLDGNGASARLRGKLSGDVPASGELTPDIVLRLFGKADRSGDTASPWLRERPPQLCPGCAHADAYEAIRALRAEIPGLAVFGDIGCYTLGYYRPHEIIDSCLDMGASIAMAKGAADAGMFPVVCVIGDSTFGHSGMPPLLTAAHENTNMVVVILDNGSVAMTGAQVSLSTGERLRAIVAGLGVSPERVRVIHPAPRDHAENVGVLREEVAHPGLSVVIAERPCLYNPRADRAAKDGGR